MKNKEKKPTVKKKTKKVTKVVKEEKDKTEFSLTEVIIIMLICIVFGLLIGGYIVSQRKGSSNGVRKIDFNELNGLYEDINSNYYGDYKSDSFRDSTINGMLSFLDDPYARIIPSKEAKKYIEDLESEFVGIGLELSQESEGVEPKVTKIYKSSPAERSKLKEGDIFVKVNGEEVNGKTLDEITSLIKTGQRGDIVTITIKRGEEIIDKRITKDIISVPTVSTKIIEKNDKKIGEIIISNFSKTTYKEFKEEYEELKKNKIDGLIIDLRDNGGGYLSSASAVTSMFLEKGKVIYIEKKKDKEEKITSSDDRIIKEKVVLLINGGTASGSEILASSLKNNINATLIGSQTYGKNTIQKMHKLKDDTIVKFTIGEWLTSEGKSIKDENIKPDKSVDTNSCYMYNSDDDPVLKEAIKEFE